MLRRLSKFLLFIASMLALVLLTLLIYLASPRLLNSTLPHVLGTDEIRYETREQAAVGTPVYVRALNEAPLMQRYALPTGDFNQLYQYFTEQGYDLSHHWDAKQNVTAKEWPVYEFEQSIAGYQLLYVRQFPKPCLDLFINRQAWFDYYLVIEMAACDE